MYNSKNRPVSWRLLIRTGDFAAVAASYPVTFLMFDRFVPPGIQGSSTLPAISCFLLTALLFGVFEHLGFYEWRNFVSPGAMLRTLLLSLMLAASAFVILCFLADPQQGFGSLGFLFTQGMLCLVLVAGVRLLIRFLEFHHLRSERSMNVAFIGWSKSMQKVLKGIVSDPLSLITVKGCILDESRSESRMTLGVEYRDLGDLRSLKTIFSKEEITTLVVDQDGISHDELRLIASVCADSMVQLMLIPWNYELWSDRLGMRIVGGVPLMVLYNLPIGDSANLAIKRLIDIVGAVVGLLLSAPLIALLAVLIKRESPGPVLYWQERSGRGGKTFMIAKMRSMHLDAEKETGAVWAVENDPRRLRIGALMRRFNLDELPQFWNVLHGEMSLVGPRPERPELIEKFRDSVRYYTLRHLFKPGLTGWAAVNGLRGNTSLEGRLEHDLYYIENWSILLDLKILVMTLLPPKNAI